MDSQQNIWLKCQNLNNDPKTAQQQHKPTLQNSKRHNVPLVSPQNLKDSKNQTSINMPKRASLNFLTSNNISPDQTNKPRSNMFKLHPTHEKSLKDSWEAALPPNSSTSCGRNETPKPGPHKHPSQVFPFFPRLDIGSHRCI